MISSKLGSFAAIKTGNEILSDVRRQIDQQPAFISISGLFGANGGEHAKIAN